jgi:hypothetical protein
VVGAPPAAARRTEEGSTGPVTRASLGPGGPAADGPGCSHAAPARATSVTGPRRLPAPSARPDARTGASGSHAVPDEPAGRCHPSLYGREPLEWQPLLLETGEAANPRSHPAGCCWEYAQASVGSSCLRLTLKFHFGRFLVNMFMHDSAAPGIASREEIVSRVALRGWAFLPRRDVAAPACHEPHAVLLPRPPCPRATLAPSPEVGHASSRRCTIQGPARPPVAHARRVLRTHVLTRAASARRRAPPKAADEHGHHRTATRGPCHAKDQRRAPPPVGRSRASRSGHGPALTAPHPLPMAGPSLLPAERPTDQTARARDASCAESVSPPATGTRRRPFLPRTASCALARGTSVVRSSLPRTIDTSMY